MVTLGRAGVAAGALGAPAARAAARRLLIRATLADLPSAPEQKKVPLFVDFAEEFWTDYSPHWKPSTRTRPCVSPASVSRATTSKPAGSAWKGIGTIASSWVVKKFSQ